MSDLYNTTTDLDLAACGTYPEFEKVPGHQRRSLVRSIRRLAMRRISAGATDPESIAEEVRTELMQTDEFSSIVLIIGLAVASAVIQWVVKKLLDKWFTGGIT